MGNEIPEVRCVLCEKYKPKTAHFWDKEDIVPVGFGNDNKTAILEYKICKYCNNFLGNSIDTPFLRNVKSREIERNHGIKPRKKRDKREEYGSGIFVGYKTFAAHLFECIKIAFETHVMFLGDEYRDDTFHVLRKLLLDVITEYDNLRARQPILGRNTNEKWSDIDQLIVAIKYFQIINNHVYRLDEIVSNIIDIENEFQSRSGKGSYANLVQLCCMNSGIYALILLQSLPPIAVRVSNELDRYIKEYGKKGIHVIDLRSIEKWAGYENDGVDN